MKQDLIMERWCRLAGVITEQKKDLHVFDFDDTLGITKSATIHIAFDYNGGDINDPASYSPVTDLSARIGKSGTGKVRTSTEADITTDGLSGDRFIASPDYLQGAQAVVLNTDQYKIWKSKYMSGLSDPTRPLVYPNGNVEELVKKAAAKMNGKPGEIHAVDFSPSSGLGDAEPIEATLAKFAEREGAGDVTAVVTARKGQTGMGTFGGKEVVATNVEDIKDFMGDETGEHPDYVFGAADFGNKVADNKREIIKNIVGGSSGGIDDIYFYDDDTKNANAVQGLEDDEEMAGRDLNIFNYEFADGASPEKPSYHTKIGKKSKKEARERKDMALLREFINRAVMVESVARPYYEGVVINALKKMVGPRGLPVTHETPSENMEGIRADGQVEGTYGIFFSVGHLKKPAFVTGKGFIIHGYLPARMINANYIAPDMSYAPGGFGEDDMLTGDEEDSWEVMWNDTRGNMWGSLIGTNLDEWPEKYWENVIPNGL
tara:strand:- start:1588 stop:3054 length:1467 start_codon:yes stop_codon:yes gene_type:complete